MGFQYDSRSEVVWLDKRQRLPDACCSCGMFTDNQVTVKHLRLTTGVAKSGGSGLMFLLSLVLHVGLGPIGWLLGALIEGKEDKNKTKTVKEKLKIRITQCTMCHGTEPPRITESNGSAFAFLVHPEFKAKLEAANRLDDED